VALNVTDASVDIGIPNLAFLIVWQLYKLETFFGYHILNISSRYQVSFFFNGISCDQILVAKFFQSPHGQKVFITVNLPLCSYKYYVFSGVQDDLLGES